MRNVNVHEQSELFPWSDPNIVVGTGQARQPLRTEPENVRKDRATRSTAVRDGFLREQLARQIAGGRPSELMSEIRRFFYVILETVADIVRSAGRKRPPRRCRGEF